MKFKVMKMDYRIGKSELGRLKDLGEKKTFYIYARIGCPRRSLEASKLYTYLVSNNLIPVNNPEKADLIFIYSCGGLAIHEEFSKLTIEQSLKNKSARTIVTGCLPKINQSIIEKYTDAILIPPEDFGQFDSLLHATVPFEIYPKTSIVNGVHELFHGNLGQRISRNIGLNRELIKICGRYMNRLWSHKSTDTLFPQTTFNLEIAKGCLGNCTYCAVKFAMPTFCSSPEEQILDEFTSGLKAGYTNFALVAGDIGCYGTDTKTNLPTLLNKLFEIDGSSKFILVDLGAGWFVRWFKELATVIKNNPGKISKIIIPVQSGSDRILKLMKRPYKIGEVKFCLLALKKNNPEIQIETHLLIGFPGETDEDFQESLQFIKEINFSKVHAYKYEDRPGTLSSSMPGKVSKKIIQKRVKKLEKMVNAFVV
jgi:tRNA A37 methylthiotransferase MiaB